VSTKHEEAIKRQGYAPKPVAPVCGNCVHRVTTRKLPAWMERFPPCTPEVHGVEQDSCGVGQFPVMLLGSCRVHVFADVSSAA
jgi:hypothetical protein